MLRQFDRLDDRESPWLPCPQEGPDNWCRDLADRWAASIVNTRARHTYLSNKGGLILSPHSTRLFCACPEDCNSMNPRKVCKTLGGDDRCIPGCYPKGTQCQEFSGGRTYMCSYAPDFLKDALEAQQSRESYRGRNNEMVVDLRSVIPRLPHSIEAFFYVSSGGDEEMALAREVQQKFASHFGLSRAFAPPLLRLNFESTGEGHGGAIVGDEPFVMHED